MASPYDGPLVGWRSNPPRDRDSYDIISLCASTLIVCSWNAVHVDVPKRRTWRNTTGARIFWFLIGIVMPELLLTAAVGQYLNARLISSCAYGFGFKRPPPPWWWRFPEELSRCCGRKRYNVISKDAPRNAGTGRERIHAWTLTHSFYALMGGFPDIDPDDLGNWKFSLIQNTPDVSVDDIVDRSKSGPIAKAILCLQILFFCANCAARINQRLPLSLLEITTIAHSLCALGAYAVWWNKPQDVGGEAPLRDEEGILQYLISSVISHFSVTVISFDLDSFPSFDTWSSLLSVLLVVIPIATLYGCPHLLGLHVHFASQAEHILWLISTILVIACPTLTVLAVYVADKTQSNQTGIFVRVFAMLSMMFYMIASAYLVCESIRQVFALPETAFRQVHWTRYIPHFA